MSTALVALALFCGNTLLKVSLFWTPLQSLSSLCPDAAYAETVGAAHAVLMAARHFTQHRPSRILIKGDNRPIIDFMNSVGKLRRPDLQKLLTEAQHALAFSLPPILWSYTPREFNKCADFLAGIARDYAKQCMAT